MGAYKFAKRRCILFHNENNYGYSDSVTIDTEQNKVNVPTRTAAEIMERHKTALDLPEMEKPVL